MDKMKENLYDSFRVPMSSTMLVTDVCYDVVRVVDVDCMYFVGDKCILVYRSDEDVLLL